MKCGTIIHSAKERRQQNEQWRWGLDKIWKQEGVGNIGEYLYNRGRPLCQQ